ncbi:MAG: DinB family protein [Ferruginibacter sp.]
MVIETLKKIFTRDLDRLYNEIQLYQNENAIWKTEKQIANAAGNLCLHIIGNLNTYIGKEIGNTGYIRNREQEFSLKNVSKQQLLSQVATTIEIVNASLDKLNDATLENEYPVLVFEEKTTTGYLLIHLATHLTYHLGQINYHRRLIDELKN